MVDLTKANKVSFKIDELTKLRAQVGLYIGTFIGMAGILTVILITGKDMNLWYKIFICIGFGCGLLLQLGGILGAIARLKAYQSAMEQMKNWGQTQAGAGAGTPPGASYIQ